MEDSEPILQFGQQQFLAFSRIASAQLRILGRFQVLTERSIFGRIEKKAPQVGMSQVMGYWVGSAV